jgi:hypothetical protein
MVVTMSEVTPVPTVMPAPTATRQYLGLGLSVPVPRRKQCEPVRVIYMVRVNKTTIQIRKNLFPKQLKRGKGG